MLKERVQTPASAAASTDAVNAPNAVVAPNAVHDANAARAPRVADAGNAINATYAPNAIRAPGAVNAPNMAGVPDVANVRNAPDAPATAISTISAPDNGIAALPPPRETPKTTGRLLQRTGQQPGRRRRSIGKPSGQPFFSNQLAE